MSALLTPSLQSSALLISSETLPIAVNHVVTVYASNTSINPTPTHVVAFSELKTIGCPQSTRHSSYGTISRTVRAFRIHSTPWWYWPLPNVTLFKVGLMRSTIALVAVNLSNSDESTRVTLSTCFHMEDGLLPNAQLPHTSSVWVYMYSKSIDMQGCK